ncbi:MAG: 30S ribosomal protein S12 methylthiotransferase RimO [Lachnospiraceae bacterium]|nr:30S ribosomal protein S12 methylthiotransferase RimO [Lachnospiraceae bacterium]
MNILFVSLGCDKNLVDSEMMLGELTLAGHTIVNEEAQADAVIVNTCCFILDAKEESINTLLEYAEMKQQGEIRALIATGCLAQRYAKEIHEEIPEVDAVVGTAGFDRIVSVLENIESGAPEDALGDIHGPAICGKKRLLTTGGHYAYLKIAEGCDKRCTYCIIPSIRGSFRSVPMETLLKEATSLAEGGVKELILVAQETTVYGTDLYGRKALPELLEKLSRIEELSWIRLLYCYPEEIDEDLIAVMKKEPKICHYLDIPVQHADDYILQRMGRRTNRADLERIIATLRKEIPDICLRTTLITGFPGEEQKHFDSLKEFVEKMRFERLGVFAYSPEEDTVAAAMPCQVEDEVKEARRDEIMSLQQTIAFEKAEGMVGKTIPVLVEGRLVEDGVLIGRSYMDAPGVDGYVFIRTDRDIESGRIVSVVIEASNEYDLIGGLEDEFTE